MSARLSKQHRGQRGEGQLWGQPGEHRGSNISGRSEISGDKTERQNYRG